MYTSFKELPSLKQVKVDDRVLMNGEFWNVKAVHRYSLELERKRPGLISNCYPSLAMLRRQRAELHSPLKVEKNN